MTAEFALQASTIAPNPLGVSMMLATDFFVLSKILDYPVECTHTVHSIGTWRKLLLDSLICRILESVFEPEGTVACFPDFPADIAELCSTPVNCQCRSSGIEFSWDEMPCLPTCDVVTSLAQFYHVSTAKASLPVLAFGHFQHAMK